MYINGTPGARPSRITKRRTVKTTSFSPQVTWTDHDGETHTIKLTSAPAADGLIAELTAQGIEPTLGGWAR